MKYNNKIKELHRKYLKYKKKYVKSTGGSMTLHENRKKYNKTILLQDKIGKIELGNSIRIVSHNLGGQTIVDNGIRRFLNTKRGFLEKNDKVYTEHIANDLDNPRIYNTTHTLGESISHSKNKDMTNEYKADIYFYQEYQKQTHPDYPVLQRLKDLVFNIKQYSEFSMVENPNFDSYDKMLSRKFRCPLDLFISDGSLEPKVSIKMYNFHGIIISNTSSLKQINECLELLTAIVTTTEPIIIAGDFNFDFFDDNVEDDIICSMENTEYMYVGEPKKTEAEIKKIKTHVKNHKKEIIKKVRDIKTSLLDKFSVFPPNNKESKVVTNTWTIDKSLTQKCVDYILVSKDIVDTYVEKAEFSVRDDVMATTNKTTTIMENDYDHALIMLDLIFKKGYTCYFDKPAK